MSAKMKGALSLNSLRGAQMDRREKLAYGRGYNAGSKGVWPEHRPPLPPHRITNSVVGAARELRDAVDGICAKLSEDDEFVQVLGPLIDTFDEAMIRYGEWIRSREAQKEEHR